MLFSIHLIFMYAWCCSWHALLHSSLNREGRGGECVSSGGILLEVVEMASHDLLDVDAGGMVRKDKGNPIAVAGRKRRGESGSAGDGLDLVDSPVDDGAGKSLL
eukprot:g30703.t1